MDGDFYWRKKELSRVKSMAMDSEGTPDESMCVRAAVALLYAHWEGFIKRTGEYYLEFVSQQKLTHGELLPGFMAMAIEPYLSGKIEGTKISRHIKMIEFIRDAGDERCHLPYQGKIETKSNLKAELFRDITSALGLDYSRFATKEKLIDEKLLKNRNHIAHGNYAVMPVADYIELHCEIVAMMQDFYNQIDNAAILGTYKR
jgi:hypothetical protein